VGNIIDKGYTDNAVARALDNGLSVTLESLPHLHSASVGMWIRCGSANEAEEQSGISHFLEHLFFKGTETRSTRQIMEPIESKGGHLNAFTSREYICVYFKALDKHIASGIEILADIIKNSTFADLEKERNVVLEEISSIEDVPDEYVHDLLALKMWPNHPLGRPVSGSEETVSNLSFSDVKNYCEQWRQPSGMFFSIAGNFDEDAVFEQVRNEFGSLPSRPAPKPCDAPAFNPGVEFIERDIGQDHFCMAFPGPTVLDKRRFAFDVLSNALGGGSTSRLFERIRENEGLAYSIYSYVSAYFSSGFLGVYAAVAPENFDRAMEMTCEEIRKFRDFSITPEELEANREQLKGSMLMSFEGTFNRMSRMARSMLYYGRMMSIAELIEGLDSVTIDDIHEIAEEILQPDKCATVVLGPTGASKKEIPL
jgi:predicted Zn-dependent peptidase